MCIEPFWSCDAHLAEHAHLHVVEEMAVKRPAAWLIGGDDEADCLPRLDVDGVLTGPVLAFAVFELAPKPMQMDGMLHHRVVDEREADPLAMFEFDRLGFREFLAVEPPDEALHVPGQVERDLATGQARIVAALGGAQIGIAEHAKAFWKTFAGTIQMRHRHHGDIVDAWFALELLPLRTEGHAWHLAMLHAFHAHIGHGAYG